MEHSIAENQQLTRRHLFSRAAGGLGAAALTTLMQTADATEVAGMQGGLPELPHLPPQAKRVIYLMQSGGPSHIDLFDYKPQLREHHGEELPDSIRQGQRLTEMTHKQKEKPCVATAFKFSANFYRIRQVLPMKLLLSNRCIPKR